MKTVMKRNVLFVIAAVLVLSLSVGFASAYFSDHEAAQGAAVIHMGGQSKVVEKVDENSKSVQVQNIGDTEIVVRVAIYGPTNMKVGPEPFEKWVKIGDFYYYKTALKPDPNKEGNGELTEAGSLVASTVYPAGTDLGDQYQIVVVQECEQAQYDSNNNLLPMDKWFAKEKSGEGE